MSVHRAVKTCVTSEVESGARRDVDDIRDVITTPSRAREWRTLAANRCTDERCRRPLA